MKRTEQSVQSGNQTVRLSPLAKSIAVTLSGRFDVSQQAIIEIALHNMRNVRALSLPAIDRRSKIRNRRTATACLRAECSK